MAAIAQTTIAPALRVSGVAPNGMLVLVVCWALLRGSDEGMLCGLFAGLAVGLLSGAPFGVHALLLTPAGYLAGLAQRSPFRSRVIVPLAVMVGATLFYTLGEALALRLSGWPLAAAPVLARHVVPALVANGLLMLPCYWLMARVVELRGALRPGF